MGDYGKHGTYSKITIKRGDSWASLFGRSFGDAMRHFGKDALVAGNTLDLSTFQRNANPFVSNADVTYAQNSAGPNYKGPEMQRYGDYVENYKAAIEAGYSGVGQAAAMGVGQQRNGLPAGGNAGGAYAAGGANDPNRPSITPNYNTVTAPTGRDAAAAWTAAHPAGSAQPTVGSGAINAVASAEIGSSLTNPRQLNGKEPAPLFPQVIAGAQIGSGLGSSGSSLTNPRQLNGREPAPLVVTATPPAPKTPTPTTSVQQQATVAAQNQQTAYQYTQNIMSNQNVPITIPAEISQLIMEDARLRGGVYEKNIYSQISSMYDVSPVDNKTLVPRGTRFLPGTGANNETLTDVPPGSYEYSNIPPYGYGGGGGNGGGRRGGGGGGGGGGHRTRGIRTNDYSLGLGQ